MVKRKFLALLLIACLCASMAGIPGALAADSVSAGSPGTGKLTVSVTGTPGQDCDVVVYDNATDGVVETKNGLTLDAGSGGASHTFNLSAGTYYARAYYTADGSLIGVSQPETVAGAGVAPPSTVPAVTASSPSAGALAVTVTGDTGNQVVVVLYNSANDAVVDPGVTLTLSGASGVASHTFSGLAAGTYFARAYYVGQSDMGVSGHIPVGASGTPAPVVAITITEKSGGVNKITVKGTAEKGKTVALYVTGAEKATAVADAGSGAYTLVATGLAAGTYVVEVRAVSPYSAATVSAGNLVVTDKVNLVVNSAALVGRNQLRVTGTGAPGSKVKLDIVGGPSLNITVDADGRFDDIIPNLPVGTYTTLTASYIGTDDIYGSNPASPTIGSWVVVAATTNDIAITKVTTAIGAVTIEGTGKAGAAVTAIVGGYSGGATTDANGKFSIKITLPAGTYSGAEVRYNTSGIGNSASIADKIVIPSAATPTPAPTGSPTSTPPGGTYPTLSRGMINSYVVTLQQYLKSLGYYTIAIDGNFGVGTQTAVRNFQIMNGLPATGIADDATQKKLYSGTAIGIGGNPSTGGYTTLRFGSRGTNVRSLQTRLANLGYYYGSIDGIFGSQTEAAVRNFQSRNNLAVTGVADSATQTAAYSSTALANSNTSTGYVYLHYGSRGAAVTRLQTALKNAGYYKGAIDGQYYDQTYAAVKSFQRAKGLVVDGIAGKQTQNKLYGTSY